MNLSVVSGPPRRDPLFLTLCLVALVIAVIAERGSFVGVQVHRWTGAAGAGAPLFDWLLLGPFFGGIVAYFLGRHWGLGTGGVLFAGGAVVLLAAPSSPLGLGLFALGHGLLVPCFLALAAVWLGNDRPNARLALFFLLAIGGQLAMIALPGAAIGEGGPFLVAAFAALALFCAAGLAALDFWAGRGFDLAKTAEKPPTQAQWETVALLIATGILCYAALGCAFQQQQATLQSWQGAGQQFGWLATLGTVLNFSLLVVGVLLALMGTFMNLPRLGVAATIPFALTMAAIAVLCGLFSSGSGDPRIAVVLLSSMALGFLQMALVPILSAIAGGVGPRFAPLALGLYLGLGGPLFGRLLGETVAGAGKSAMFPFAFLLVAAAAFGHFLGRRADAALDGPAKPPAAVDAA